METHKLKKVKMQVAKIFAVTVMLSCLTNCKAQKKPENSSDEYKLTVYRSKNGSTYLDLSAFEHENKTQRFPAAYQINNIIFSITALKNLTLHVTSGKFTVKAGAISKKWTEIENLNIKKGDSVALKIFLKNDPEPLYHNEKYEP